MSPFLRSRPSSFYVPGGHAPRLHPRQAPVQSRQGKGGRPEPASRTRVRPLAEEHSVRESPEDAADDRGDDRDPGVPPVRAPLARYREDGVGDARAEVASRIYRVSGGTTERQADA